VQGCITTIRTYTPLLRFAKQQRLGQEVPNRAIVREESAKPQSDIFDELGQEALNKGDRVTFVDHRDGQTKTGILKFKNEMAARVELPDGSKVTIAPGKIQKAAAEAGSQSNDRRQNVAKRKAVAEMSAEERSHALLTSEKTQLPNYRAFNEHGSEIAKSHPHVGYADLDDFKQYNTAMGHEAVDHVVLPAMGDFYRDALEKEEPGSVHVYHRSGDEFLMRAKDPAAIDRVNRHVNELLAKSTFQAELPDGTIVEKKGTGLSYGKGTDEASAERGASSDKRIRKAAGLRSGERDVAAAVVEQPAQGVKAGGSEGSKENLPYREPAPNEVGKVRTADIDVEPHNFQFKLNTDAKGTGEKLKEVEKFDPAKAGVISVWKNPADGRFKVVNGHHRVELARRVGAPEMNVFHISANSIPEARAIGAEQNIAEGTATPLDVAKYFRDAGITPEKIKTAGLSMKSQVVKEGLALSSLEDGIFSQVVKGDIRLGRAVTIGEATKDHAEQKAVLDLVDQKERKGERITDETLSELIRFTKESEKKTETTQNLFGFQEVTRSLALEKAEVSAFVKQSLSKDKRLFGFVAKAQRAQELERVGNKIDVEKNKQISTEAAQAEAVYEKLSSRAGPISAILEESASRLASGDNANAVKQQAYARVRAEVSRVLTGQQAEPSTNGRGAEEHSGQPEADGATRSDQEGQTGERKNSVDLFRRASRKHDVFGTNYSALADALTDEALAKPEVAGMMRDEIRAMPIYEGPEKVSPETLRWWTRHLLYQYADGGEMPYPEKLVDAVLSSLDPDELAKFQDLRTEDLIRTARQQGFHPITLEDWDDLYRNNDEHSQLHAWAASRTLQIEEQGTQPSLFGGEQKMYRLTRIADGKPERILITEDQLNNLAQQYPNVRRAMVESKQDALYGLQDLGEIIGNGAKPQKPNGGEGQGSLFRGDRAGLMRQQADPISKMKFSYTPPQGDVAGYIKLDRTASIVMRGVTGDNFIGYNMDPAKAKVIAESLRSAAERAASELNAPTAAARMRKLAETMDRALKENGDRGVNFVAEATPKTQALTIAEELFHSTLQRGPGKGDVEKGVPFEALREDPALNKMAPRIKEEVGSDAPEYFIAAEAIVDTVLDEAPELSQQEQRAFMERYWHVFADKVGDDQLEIARQYFERMQKEFEQRGIIAPKGLEDGRQAVEAVRSQRSSRAGSERKPEEVRPSSEPGRHGGNAGGNGRTEEPGPSGEETTGGQSLKRPAPQPAKEPFKFEDEEMESAYQAAHGLKPVPIKEKIVEAAERLKNYATRHFPELPRGEQFEPAAFVLRNLEKQRAVTREKTAELLSDILSQLNPEEYNRFERYVQLRDLAATAKENLPLPAGFTPENVDKELQRLENAMGITPASRAAFQTRKAAWDDLKKEYFKAMKEIGFDATDRLKREDYYRHQVLEYAQASGVFGTPRKLKSPTNRGFLKQREGSELPINTDYLQAEYEVMADMKYDIEVARAIKSIGDNYDVADELKRYALKANEAGIMEYFKALVLSNPANITLPEDVVSDIARQEFRALNQKQAIAISKLETLAARGELPTGKDGEFADLVEELGQLAGLNKEDRVSASDMGFMETGEFPEGNRLSEQNSRKLMAYANYLLKEHGGEKGSGAAAMLFKGIDEKRKFIKERLGKDFVTWRDLIPEGYTAWQPREGTSFYFTNSIPQQVAEKLYEGAAKEIGISEEQLRQVLARGSRFREMVLPGELASTLDNLRPPRVEGPLGNIPKYAINKWKQWQLLNPARALKYNLRNLSGDAEAVFIGNPSSFKRLPQAISELYDFIKDHKKTPTLRKWIDRGGIESMLQAQEMGEINSLEMFKNLYEKQKTGSLKQYPEKLWQGYWKTMRVSTDFREALLRYASFLDYLEQVKRGKPPKNFGASLPDEVMALTDAHDRAFKLSNDLLGAYDDISALGQFLRAHLPFYSFQEVNARRYYRFLRNSLNEAGIGGGNGDGGNGRTSNGYSDGDGAWRAFENVVGKGARATPFMAYRIGKVLLKMAAATAALTAWNYAFFPKEEDELPKDVQDSRHIIFGHHKGQIYALPRLGLLDDMLDWFGVDTPSRNLKDYLNGHKSAKDVALNILEGTPNKIAQMLSPVYKLPAELAFKKSTFPSLFNPRPIADRAKYLMQQFSLGYLYDKATGKPTMGIGHNALSMFVNEYDAGASAYYDILSMKRDYLQKLGKSVGDDYALSPKAEALRSLKAAIRFGDKTAYDRYAKKYMMLGGDEDALQKSLERLQPLSGMSEDEQEGFVASLSRQERLQLQLAYDYYSKYLAQ
jgi:GGDEF domain-containing protein/ParB-like chromosome segregation protein Spo0J